jgi:hypothetical protein
MSNEGSGSDFSPENLANRQLKNLHAPRAMQCGGFSVRDSHAFNSPVTDERRAQYGNNNSRWKAFGKWRLFALNIRHCANRNPCLVYASISVVDAIRLLLKN